MNKTSKELLDKAIKLDRNHRTPLFKGIHIIQQRKLHDSGYRMMYVIGFNETEKYYLISCISDVIDFQPSFNELLKGNYDMCDLHLDISKDGIISIWTNSDKRLKCTSPFLSSCTFEIVGDKE